MNYLEMVNALRVEVGVSGPRITSLNIDAPLETQRLARFVQTAWHEIQAMHEDWFFRTVESSDTMEVGQAVQGPTEFASGNVRSWKLDTFRYALPRLGYDRSEAMQYIPWDEFRLSRDTVRRGRPDCFTVRPRDNAVVVSYAPDEPFSLFCDYTRTLQTLRYDADVPIMPADFHEAIVFKAKERYGAYEDDSGVYDDGKFKATEWLQRLQTSQLPTVGIGTLEL